MPIVPLRQISYEDYNNQQRVIDTLNENFRLIDWLLNQRTAAASNSNLAANPTYNFDIAGNTLLDAGEYGGATINMGDGAKVTIDTDITNTQPVSDSYGLNPKFMKMYPNKCWNSSFEIFETLDEKLKPTYWDTEGICSPDSNFSGTYSLKLESGQTANQRATKYLSDTTGNGLANPSWWGWSSHTRYSFRIKGGSVRVRVTTDAGEGVTLPLTVDVINKNGEATKATSEGRQTNTISAGDDTPPEYEYSLEVYNGVDWTDGLRTFTAQTNGRNTQLQLSLECISGTAYIDDVVVEPDYTGKWPSFYTHGPESDPGGSGSTAEGYLEIGIADWNIAGVAFIFENNYTETPIPTASVVTRDASNVDVGGISFVYVPTIDQSGVYTGVTAIPKGESLTSISSGQVTLQAYCTGKV